MMHYIADCEKLKELSKKAKPSDMVTLLSKEGTMYDAATLNEYASLKAKKEICVVKSNFDVAALIGYYVGKEGKTLTVMHEIGIPDVLKEYIKPVKAKTSNKTVTASSKKKDEKTAIATTKAKKEASFEKSVNPPVTDAKDEVSPSSNEKNATPKATKRTRAASTSKKENKIIDEIASSIKDTPENTRKRLVSCFVFEDEPNGAKDSVTKSFSEEVWNKIESIKDTLWHEANSAS